jgi:hypothetical protein
MAAIPIPRTFDSYVDPDMRVFGLKHDLIMELEHG